MGFTKEIIEKKVASIRSTYLLEKKKINDSHHTGTGTDDIYHSTLPWFQHMTILSDVIIPRKTLDNLESQKKIQINLIMAFSPSTFFPVFWFFFILIISLRVGAFLIIIHTQKSEHLRNSFNFTENLKDCL
nr:unnamed protein product [Callosobruchus chinensis]